MRLIDNWRAAPKMLSVRCGSLGVFLAGLWLALPEAAQRTILEKFGVNGVMVTIGVTFLASVAGRLIKQESVSGPAEPPVEPLPVIDGGLLKAAFAPTQPVERWFDQQK